MKETRYYIEKVAAGLRALQKHEVPDYLIYAGQNDYEYGDACHGLEGVEKICGIPIVYCHNYINRDSDCPFFLCYKSVDTIGLLICAERKFVEAYEAEAEEVEE